MKINEMILFIAHYPTKQNEQEGMMQRISAIDKVFQDKERVYAQISLDTVDSDFISEKLKIYKINYTDQRDIRKLRDLILQARIIYVHSIYNAQYILPFYKYKKVITDMHGIVPEETLYYGRKKSALYFDNIENFVLHNSYLIVNVSNAMYEHFKSKYPDLKSRMITLTILDDYPVNKDKKSEIKDDKELRTIIYSGGFQKWQNIDLMLKTIKDLRDKFKFIILSKDKREFEDKINRYNLQDFVTIKSVARKDIDDDYYKADFGFILRDDIAINRVACPTKLVEYLAYGIIPIVIQPDIGDFKSSGYSYLTLNELINDRLPSSNQLHSIRNNNYNIIEKLKNTFNNSIEEIFKAIGEVKPDKKSDIYLTHDEIIEQSLNANLYIDTGSGFNEWEAIIKEISGEEELLNFDISNYNDIKSLRFVPLNYPVTLKLEQIYIISENNNSHNNITYESNTVYQKDNILIFDKYPIISIDIKDIFKPQKVFIKLNYISRGSDIYKYISRWQSSGIKDLEDLLLKKENEIKQLDLQLAEKSNLLNDIYGSHGWKILTKYYKLRDLLFPENTRRRTFLTFLFKSLLNSRKK